jgi:hypothetical protein
MVMLAEPLERCLQAIWQDRHGSPRFARDDTSPVTASAAKQSMSGLPTIAAFSAIALAQASRCCGLGCCRCRHR